MTGSVWVTESQSSSMWDKFRKAWQEWCGPPLIWVLNVPETMWSLWRQLLRQRKEILVLWFTLQGIEEKMKNVVGIGAEDEGGRKRAGAKGGARGGEVRFVVWCVNGMGCVEGVFPYSAQGWGDIWRLVTLQMLRYGLYWSRQWPPAQGQNISRCLPTVLLEPLPCAAHCGVKRRRRRREGNLACKSNDEYRHKSLYREQGGRRECGIRQKTRVCVCVCAHVFIFRY